MNFSDEDTRRELWDTFALPYLEDRLDDDTRVKVEQSLADSERLRTEAESVRNIIEILEDHKEALCPSPMELFNFAHGDVDISPTIAAHLADCPACKSQVEQYRNPPEHILLPEPICAAFEKKFGGWGGKSQTEAEASFLSS
ncbi:MAG: hypothetical protein RDU47_10865, partial [Spirochaetia bacterium]|nr:hypothetical protein [Spirochaetia bacterium]